MQSEKIFNPRKRLSMKPSPVIGNEMDTKVVDSSGRTMTQDLALFFTKTLEYEKNEISVDEYRKILLSFMPLLAHLPNKNCIVKISIDSPDIREVMVPFPALPEFDFSKEGLTNAATNTNFGCKNSVTEYSTQSIDTQSIPKSLSFCTPTHPA